MGIYLEKGSLSPKPYPVNYIYVNVESIGFKSRVQGGLRIVRAQAFGTNSVRFWASCFQGFWCSLVYV